MNPRACRPARRTRRTPCAVVLIALLGGTAAARAAAGDVSWQRTTAAAVRAATCQQLVVSRPGAGFIEVRLSGQPLPPAGVDRKIAGASVFVPERGDRATIVLYDTSGPYARTVALDGPLRWTAEGRRLCFASGGRELACGLTNGTVRYAQRIPFGSGWETAVAPCTAATALSNRVADPWRLLALAVAFAIVLALAIRRMRGFGNAIGIALAMLLAAWALVAWIDPWRIGPAWALAAPAAAVVWVLARLWRRQWRDDGAVLGLLAAAGLWAVLVPHPLVPADGVLMRDDAAAPPLWTDAAYWHFHAPQQELAFRDRPASTVFDDAAAAASETWLVLGGSVTFGWETAATTTFTALAEQQLAGEGYRVRLLNAGVGGWNLGQLDRFLRDVGDRMPLHGVVLISVLNNAAFRIVGPPTAPPCGTLLCAYAYNLSRNYLLLPVANYFLPKPNNLARYETLLDDIVSRERALGRIVVLIDETHEAQLHPAWYNRWIGGVQDRYRAVARAVAAAQGLQFHRVDDSVAQVPVDQRFTDGMHLTSAGHAAVAARLADILRPYLGTDAGR